jgi:cell division septation protein DedD
VQVAAFSREANALQEISSLAAAGYEPFLVASVESGRTAIYRVVLGQFADRGEAETLASEFVSRENRGAWVRRLDGL